MEINLIEVCRIVEHKKGFTYGPHAHARLEVNFMISGKALLKTNKDLARFSKGECMIVYPGFEHFFETEQDVKMLQIEFQEEVFANYKAQKEISPSSFFTPLATNLSGYAKIEDARYIYRCMQNIYQEVNNKRVLKNELLEIYFSELILLIKRRIKEQNKMYEVAASSPILSKAIQYIVEHYNTDFSVEELAQELSLSSRYLRQVFEKELNTNICTYLLELRLSKAKELLLSNQHTVSEVAYMSGFNTPQYFSKVFKKNTGLTPLDFSKQLFRKV